MKMKGKQTACRQKPKLKAAAAVRLVVMRLAEAVQVPADPVVVPARRTPSVRAVAEDPAEADRDKSKIKNEKLKMLYSIFHFTFSFLISHSFNSNI